MNWGLITFIDVLGFKGIWKSHESEETLKSIEKIEELAQKLKSDLEEKSGVDLWDNLKIQKQMFSDTLSFVTYLPSEKNIFEEPDKIEFNRAIRKYMLLRYFVLILTKIISKAALQKVPLLYRGCITVGNLHYNGTSFIGPAVDEAGEYFEASDGAFVFLTPSAKEVYLNRPGLLRKAKFPYFAPYDVPMKNGTSLETFTINPLLYLPKGKNRSDGIEEIMSAFDKSENQHPSVLSKAKNTELFLKYLDKWTPKDWSLREQI